MNHSKIAIRYAKAFYELCADNGDVEKARADMELIHTYISASEELRYLLSSPVLNLSEKTVALATVFSEKISPITSRFIVMVATNKRESHLLDIARVFIAKCKKSAGIATVTVTAPKALTPDAEAQLKASIESEFSVTAEISTITDPSLLGGFVMRIGDIQYDSSVSSKLRAIRKTLLN
jgi:F-type H+-transporting ATPase subunit delta